ncbi:related to Meiosis-specific APC/C activator protein AMA1 [Saccharomycodes ludwigii]|uniref:Related to Meiosis-specific APC/C activator protein AMA1 n=1 Tax=Saccharomycodes ludwigii TaxID=36035 RepID=A0A376B0X3_9ASCO|nr:hypothetical protein SCDLUD_004509 [Saccharomycodes ludwigii]KAH3899085.1 hypothetical protein SCDLUD_004509 [Saccharomycodes ludwigii]SSD58335.1 related to Meiosis-specific APC/C activator protein AMA1 [Saccharomycodes ludwigii]
MNYYYYFNFDHHDINNPDISERFIPKTINKQVLKASPDIKHLDLNTQYQLELPISHHNFESLNEILSNESVKSRIQVFAQQYTDKVAALTSALKNVNNEKFPKNSIIKQPYKEQIAEALHFHASQPFYNYELRYTIEKLSSMSTEEIIKQQKLNITNPYFINATFEINNLKLSTEKQVYYIFSNYFKKDIQNNTFITSNSYDDYGTKIFSKKLLPYRVLDAPSLKNDFYSNLISWSKKSNNIAVGLGHAIYLWSEGSGAYLLLSSTYLEKYSDYVTCVSFSPKEDYLIVGTKLGRLLLLNQYRKDDEIGLERNKHQLLSAELKLTLNKGICCISWFQKDTAANKFFCGDESGEVHCIEVNRIAKTVTVPKDELDIISEVIEKISSNESVGGVKMEKSRKQYESVTNPDVLGNHLYKNKKKESDREYGFKTKTVYFYELKKLVKFKCQTQQVCGIDLKEGASANNKSYIAVGGNDNSCTLWNITDLKSPQLMFYLPHKAAVKAISFCPWASSLLATGGGSKDRTIRFWHSETGTLLREIHTEGQITSLIWSTRKKQILATFGFGNVDDPLLIQCFSYPKMNIVSEVKVAFNLRVLSAVASPDVSSICIATNDETVRFYNLWNPTESVVKNSQESGIYGSSIIEHKEGIQKFTELIR